jgi:hypothetical protein
MLVPFAWAVTNHELLVEVRRLSTIPGRVTVCLEVDKIIFFNSGHGR